MICNLPRPEVAEIDLSAERIWPPARLEQLSGWRCRLDRGVSRRANSVLATAWSGGDLEQACRQVDALYRQVGLRPCFQITPAMAPAELDAELSRRDYRREGESRVLRLAASDVVANSASDVAGVDLSPAPTTDWVTTYGEGRADGEAAVKAEILGRIAPPQVYASIGGPGDLEAVGVAICDGPRGWINCMHTRPDRRRRGLAGRVLTALAGWLVGAGGRELFLQVEADNPAAQQLYQGFGFETIYGYHYRALS